MGALDVAGAGCNRAWINLWLGGKNDKTSPPDLSRGTAAAALMTPAGARTAAGESGGLSQGAWSQVHPWPTVAIHQVLLPNNKILSWNYEGGGNNIGASSAFVVDIPPYGDPSTTWLEVPNTTTNLFCSGHAFLGDGRLLVAGGHNGDPYIGTADINLFESGDGYRWVNPNTPMSGGRWYASAITLANGDVLVLSGSMSGKENPNPLPQVYVAASGTWRNLVTALAAMDNYPKIYLTPDGRVVSIGRERVTTFLDTSGTGSWTQGPAHLSAANRAYGSSVNFDTGKYMVIGGATAAGGVNTTEVLDLNVAGPAWQWANPDDVPAPPLQRDAAAGRQGAGDGRHELGRVQRRGRAVFAAELWDPATGLWSQWPARRSPVSITRPRSCCRTCGCWSPAAGRPAAERTTGSTTSTPRSSGRPISASARRRSSGGRRTWSPTAPTSRSITPNAAEVQYVRLISHGCVTHSFNMNQRMQTLAFARSAEDPTRLDVQMGTQRQPPAARLLHAGRCSTLWAFRRSPGRSGCPWPRPDRSTQPLPASPLAFAVTGPASRL